jgi:hypothetical protein
MSEPKFCAVAFTIENWQQIYNALLFAISQKSQAAIDDLHHRDMHMVPANRWMDLAVELNRQVHHD